MFKILSGHVHDLIWSPAAGVCGGWSFVSAAVFAVVAGAVATGAKPGGHWGWYGAYLLDGEYYL